MKFRVFGKAKEEAKEPPMKVHITHLGGHRIDPYELMNNKRAQDLIHKMAKIKVTKKRN